MQMFNMAVAIGCALWVHHAHVVSTGPCLGTQRAECLVCLHVGVQGSRLVNACGHAHK